MTNFTIHKPAYKEFKKDFRYASWSDKGELVHIAHATGLCAGVYSEFAKKLADRHRVIGLDFRGHGMTKAPADPGKLHNWDVFSNDLEGFFRSFSQPLVAIGHSLGGTISAVLAARYPELISKLVLIEPGFMPPLWRPFVYMVQKTGVSMHVPFVTSATKRTSVWETKNKAKSELRSKGPFKSWKSEVLEDYIRDGTAETGDGLTRLQCSPLWEGRILATAPCDIWKDVSRVKSSTLVLYGERSKTFLPSVVTKIKKLLPHAIIKKMPNTGHFVPMEHPAESAEIVSRFIEEGDV